MSIQKVAGEPALELSLDIAPARCRPESGLYAGRTVTVWQYPIYETVCLGAGVLDAPVYAGDDAESSRGVHACKRCVLEMWWVRLDGRAKRSRHWVVDPDSDRRAEG